MSDEQQAGAHMARFNTIEFDGDTLPAVILDGEGVAIPIRTICQALGLDVQSQSDRLREHDVLADGLRVVRVPRGRQLRPVMALLHRFIPFWLATIVPSQVKPAVRAKLVRYQLELVDVLALLYGGDVQSRQPTAVDPAAAPIQRQITEALLEIRLLRDALLEAQNQADSRLTLHERRIDAIEDVLGELQDQFTAQTTITAAQQEVIKRSIQRLARRYEQHTGQPMFARLFGQFCIDLGTPKYALLPASRYNEALSWLRTKAAELLPNDPDALPPLQETLL
jgi:uncharacterized coiled-coil protein SlyX